MAFADSVFLEKIVPGALLTGKAYNITIFGYGFNKSDPDSTSFSYTWRYEDNQLHVIDPNHIWVQTITNAIVSFPAFNHTGTIIIQHAKSSNLLALNVHEVPEVLSVAPNLTFASGGEDITIQGSGFFSSDTIEVVLTHTDSFFQVATGQYMNDRSTIVFQAPQVLLPEVQAALNPNEMFLANISLSLTFDGVVYLPISCGFQVKIKPTFTVGYIFHGPIDDFGWTYNMNVARMQIDEDYSGLVTSKYVAFVPNEYDAAMEVVLSYCQENYDLIFGGSFGFLWAMADASFFDECNYLTDAETGEITDETKVSYMAHVGGFFQTPSMATVFGKIYQMRYLSGLAAGFKLQTLSTNKVGYLAAFPIAEVRRGINAFLLGCQETYPDCRVQLVWIGTWNSEYIEEKAAEFLWVQGCRIIAQHTNTMTPQILFAEGGPREEDIIEYASLNGLNASELAAMTKDLGTNGFGLGYNSDVRQLVGDSVLTSPMLRWTPMVEFFIENVMRESWPTTSSGDAISYWPDAQDDAVTLAPFSPWLSRQAQEYITTKWELLKGRTDNIFCGNLTMDDGSPVPAIQPSNDLTYGGGGLNFYHPDTGLPCNQSEVATGECCLSEWPGLLDMWYQLQGAEAPDDCTDQTKCVFGTVIHEINSAGHLLAWYTPPPKTIPERPSLFLQCEDNQAEDFSSIKVQYFGLPSTEGDAIESFTLEWDTSANFDSPDRTCEEGNLCQVFTPTSDDLEYCNVDEYSLCHSGIATGLKSGTNYHFRIFSSDGTSLSEASDAETCRTKFMREVDTVGFKTQLIFVLLCCLGALVALVNLYYVCKYRKHVVIRSTSFRFNVLVNIAIIIGYCSIFTLTGTPTDTKCMIRPWVIVISMTLTFAPIFAKARRIHILINKAGMRRMKIPDRVLMKEIMVYLFIDVVVLSLMTCLDPYKAMTQDASYSDFKSTVLCKDGSQRVNVFLVVILVLKIGMLLYGVSMAYQVRNVPENFNESKHIGGCLYNFFLSSHLITPLIFVVEKPSLLYILKGMLIFWACSGSLFAMYIPKWAAIQTAHQRNARTTQDFITRSIQRINPYRTSVQNRKDSNDSNRSPASFLHNTPSSLQLLRTGSLRVAPESLKPLPEKKENSFGFFEKVKPLPSPLKCFSLSPTATKEKELTRKYLQPHASPVSVLPRNSNKLGSQETTSYRL